MEAVNLERKTNSDTIRLYLCGVEPMRGLHLLFSCNKLPLVLLILYTIIVNNLLFSSLILLYCRSDE